MSDLSFRRLSARLCLMNTSPFPPLSGSRRPPLFLPSARILLISQHIQSICMINKEHFGGIMRATGSVVRASAEQKALQPSQRTGWRDLNGSLIRNCIRTSSLAQPAGMGKGGGEKTLGLILCLHHTEFQGEAAKRPANRDIAIINLLGVGPVCRSIQDRYRLIPLYFMCFLPWCQVSVHCPGSCSASKDWTDVPGR